MTPADERRFLDLVNTAVAFQKQGDLAGAILNYKKAVAGGQHLQCRHGYSMAARRREDDRKCGGVRAPRG